MNVRLDDEQMIHVMYRATEAAKLLPVHLRECRRYEIVPEFEDILDMTSLVYRVRLVVDGDVRDVCDVRAIDVPGITAEDVEAEWNHAVSLITWSVAEG
ncbi:hypothetical protein AB0K40_13145 [Nonomuraea bangladeshensis]|uniref:Uncharacterized protein n=1 Tax=Nonomuraea bangladeshensis TaxID=404385 RepID=A0ABV3H1N2_9ACTN